MLETHTIVFLPGAYRAMKLSYSKANEVGGLLILLIAVLVLVVFSAF